MIVTKTDLYEYFGCGFGGATIVSYLRDEPICGGIRPCALIIPGGGYTHVSRREGEPVALGYVAAGFDAFVLDYTCNAKYPASAFDAALAAAYIRENAKKNFCDPHKLVFVGFSAGAHLAGTVALLADDPILSEKLDDAGVGKRVRAAGVVPDALVFAYPVVTGSNGAAHRGSFEVLTNGDNRLIDLLSLEKRVKKNSPPAFIWHTADDGSVPVMNSLVLAEAYARAKVPFELRVYSRGRHGLSTADRESYAKTDKPDFSAGVSDWLSDSATWLNEMGFAL